MGRSAGLNMPRVKRKAVVARTPEKAAEFIETFGLKKTQWEALGVFRTPKDRIFDHVIVVVSNAIHVAGNELHEAYGWETCVTVEGTFRVI